MKIFGLRDRDWFSYMYNVFRLLSILVSHTNGLDMASKFYLVLNKVLTTIETTAYSVEQLTFPTVTFCSPGFNDAILQVSI